MYQSPDRVFRSSFTNGALDLQRLQSEPHSLRESIATYPVCTQLHGVGVSIRVFPELGMSTSSSNFAVVLDDHKVRDGRIRECLLLGQSVSHGSIDWQGEMN